MKGNRMGVSLKPIPLHEATVAGLRAALDRGETTSEELTRRSLERVRTYDPRLHAIPIINPAALEEARASDARRATGTVGPLEGIPFTVKDSYMVRGLTVAAGSPAFAHLTAHWDAFTVAQLRTAGAVLIGKTNMPPMADGGMQRGLYGRAESPYNTDYLPAAYASGSSNGSGTATTTSMAVFGMGEETVSSGRSPASNSALCAYTPSWGIISIRGNWPLFPARDVVVPHTRTMVDMLEVLDVLVADDPETRGDFWRNQQVIDIPRASEHRPESYPALATTATLSGKRFAVPRMFLGHDPLFPIEVRSSVRELWQRARARIEALGAEVIETDFPLIEAYEGDQPGAERVGQLGVLPEGWMDTEFTHFLAYGWDDFLRANGDPVISSLAGVDPDLIFPTSPGQLPDRYQEVEHYEERYRATVAYARRGIPDPRERHDFAEGLRGIVRLRETLFEGWLRDNGYDGVVFPANSDVARANADVDGAAADHAWSNGVFFSNGNYALRHLGIPTVTVPMGIMSDIGMPVGLTFAAAAYDDLEVLSWGSAFEAPGSLRVAPPSTPELE